MDNCIFINDSNDFLIKLSSFLEIDEDEKKVFLSQFEKAKALNKEITYANNFR